MAKEACHLERRRSRSREIWRAYRGKVLQGWLKFHFETSKVRTNYRKVLQLSGGVRLTSKYMSVSNRPNEEEFDPYEGAPEPKIYWCLHCGRTYLPKQFRIIGGRELCPYEGCDGSVFADGVDWADVRRGHSDYPEIPDHGKVYKL